MVGLGSSPGRGTDTPWARHFTLIVPLFTQVYKILSIYGKYCFAAHDILSFWGTFEALKFWKTLMKFSLADGSMLMVKRNVRILVPAVFSTCTHPLIMSFLTFGLFS